MRRAARLAILVAAMLPVAALGDASPRVVLAQPGIGDGAVERFTARFSQPMVALGDPRTAAPFAVDCAVPGAGRWVDPQTFAWEFRTPLPGGTSCSFTVRPRLRSTAGYAVVGTTVFTVDAGGPVARAVLPSAYGSEVEEDQVFLVAANMPPTAASVAAHAYCAVDGIGEKIPVDVLAPDLPGKLLAQMADGWDAKSFLGNAGLPDEMPADAASRRKALAGVTALRCHRPLPPGRDMALVWGAAIAGAGGRTAGTDQRFDFTVHKPFTARFECGRVNAQAGCSPVEKAYLRFTAPIPMSAARSVRLTVGDRAIAPVFSDEEKGKATISDLTFATPLPESATAQLAIPADLKDESGRALVNAARFPLPVRFDAAPPLVKFAAGFGILEAKAGGVLPVTVRGVEPALAGRVQAVNGRTSRIDGGDGAVAGWLRRVDGADDEASHEVQRGGKTVRINDTGATPLLPAGSGTALRIGLPGQGRDFEVVGIPLTHPGFYVVELASPVLGRALLGRRAPRYVATAALVTNMAVHFKWGRGRSLAWVTALDTGRPVADAAVQVSDSCTGRVLARGTTDRAGGLNIPAGLPAPETYGDCDGEAHPLMVSARAGDDFSFTLTSWAEGIRPFDFDLPYGYSAPEDVLHTVFDRALVRQGETIHMKHILRRPDAGGFALAPGFSGTLKLSHRGSDTQFELPLTINASGVGETSWTAPAGAPMGDYDLQVVIPGAQERTIFTGQSFKLDEYRLPTMRATVTGPKEAAVRPKSMPLDLFVGYLSGGGAANLAVDLRVAYLARAAGPEGYEGYTFGGKPIAEGVRATGGDGDDEQTPLPPAQLLPATLGGDGTSRTAVEVPALDAATDMLVEMDYPDANGEVLTATRRIPVFPSAVQLGIRTDGWLMRQDDLRLRFVALDVNGRPLANRKVQVALYSRQTLTARRRLIGGFYAYDNRLRTTRLGGSCSATTDAQGLAQCAVDPGVSGEVYAVATTSDDAGNVARAVQSVWLAGDDEWWFGGDNGDRMDVVPEKTAYAAGETARFQVRMPFRAATALVTVEREGVLSSFTTQLSGKDPVVEVPMPAAYAPDVFVSVLAVRGRVEPGWWRWLGDIFESIGLKSKDPEAQPPTALVDLAKPAYRMGVAKVKVGWEGHQLKVAVKADKARYAASETAEVAVHVARPDGRPAQSADLAFVAVDEALLQLAPNDSWDVLTAMMGERPLSVLTSTAQMQVVGKRHYGRKAVEAGGGGGDASALNRENFQPVLLWRGHVTLDAGGNARVAVPLSDALSSFRLVAVATDGAQLFGTGSAQVRTAQDLSIYAGLPPLVREGDWYAAGFTLRNGSDRPMQVTADVEVTPAVAKGRPLTVTIPAGGAVPVAWNLTAPQGEGRLTWRVRARASDGRAVDAITATQDVARLVPVEVWAASLTRAAGNSLLIAPPAGALPGRGGVDVILADSLAPPLAGVRDYMSRYPYDCFEQRLSRIVALGDASGWAALAGALPTYQAPDGLLRYWPSDSLEGSEALTAYVLSLTSEAGLPIPAAPRTRMIEGLRAVLDGRLRRETYGDVRLQKIAALAALARAGAANPGMLGQIGMAPQEMPTAALADWLAAIDHLPGLANGAQLRIAGEDVLRSRLAYEGTRLDLTDAGDAAWWLMSSGDEAAARALLTVLGRPGWGDEAPRMMAGFALRQARGHWDTTTANAWGTLAARKFAQVYPATASAPTLLTLAGRSLRAAPPFPLARPAATFALPAGPSPLRLVATGDAGPWATVQVRAAVPLSQPLAAGYRLSRKVAVVQARTAGRLTRGDVVRVTLTVTAAAERNWVAVTDPVPPGATILGDLGGQSQLLQGGDTAGTQPSHVERGRDAWRGYFAWLPRGTTSVSYTLRLNGAGRFSLPPSRVEALYSPAIRAALPNAPVTVEQR